MLLMFIYFNIWMVGRMPAVGAKGASKNPRELKDNSNSSREEKLMQISHGFHVCMISADKYEYQLVNTCQIPRKCGALSPPLEILLLYMLAVESYRSTTSMTPDRLTVANEFKYLLEFERDFNFMRKLRLNFHDIRPHKDYVATRWYRSPELCRSFYSKEISLVWHHQEAEPDCAMWQAKKVLHHLESILADEPSVVKRGQQIVAVNPHSHRQVLKIGWNGCVGLRGCLIENDKSNFTFHHMIRKLYRVPYGYRMMFVVQLLAHKEGAVTSSDSALIAVATSGSLFVF
ncbi:trehalose phosphatase/synthase 11 [Artemisia annua]|uniref:Trehalose phosphatase/synthase 11 n=1 Tax=Artemisia annua TaxID=35608 RepID=A0A2U1MTL2_ARTAN|nr:trehalose phosphatase/synthase 11 [Artemisia annua]